MGVFHLGSMTLKSLFTKPETTCYPFEKRPVYEGLKGHVVIDLDTCIYCGICSKRCPVGCIEVDRPNKSWSINPFSCVQCYVCVRECPKNCLSMDGAYSAPAQAKEKVKYTSAQ